jgi:hypothetical protein
VWNREQQGSHDKRITYVAESQEYNAASVFLEDTTSEIQDPALTVHSRAPNRKRGKLTLNYLKK